MDQCGFLDSEWIFDGARPWNVATWCTERSRQLTVPASYKQKSLVSPLLCLGSRIGYLKKQLKCFISWHEIHGESWEFFWGACGRCGATHRTTLPVFDGFRNIPRVHCTTRAFTKPSLSWRKPSHKWNKSCSCLHFDTKTFSEDLKSKKKYFFCKWKTCK